MSQVAFTYNDVTSRDGVAHINIGSLAKTALGRHLGYYHASPKSTIDGQSFSLYAGFYYYLITEGDNRRFLTATTRQELGAKRKYRWENVPGIETHLESVLSYNLRQSPMAIPLIIRHPLPLVWEEPDRALTNAEKRWLRVVQRTVDRLRFEHTQ